MNLISTWLGTSLACFGALSLHQGSTTLDRSATSSAAVTPAPAVRVFIFAGQSNMVGSDSKVADIERFAPFVGMGAPQDDVRFWHCIGREFKFESDGWVDLAPIDGVVGPELTFARAVKSQVKAPIAIIKVAAGGTHLGGDWDPARPEGFKMYPLALQHVRDALAALKDEGVRYKLEGFVWHQGENDMFEDAYRESYGKNLAQFIASWRRDLGAAELPFYIGELCTKTIWGMDLRPSMAEVARGQRAATDADPLATYVPTSHVGVEIGRETGLHYHYGTLGQLQHGLCYADAYLQSIGKAEAPRRPLTSWPYTKGQAVRLFVFAGHRNMEGERAFVQDLEGDRKTKRMLASDDSIAFRYSLGGVRRSPDWEPFGSTGFQDTFGPEITFVSGLGKPRASDVAAGTAVLKFTHSGSQIADWTPEGGGVDERHLYADFVAFVGAAIDDLEARGHDVEVAGVFYHLGENDTAWMPFRKAAAKRLRALVTGVRKDLELSKLKWFVSQNEPSDHEAVAGFDVRAAIESICEQDPHMVHVDAFELPGREQALVLRTPGIVALGERLVAAYQASLR